MKTEMCLRKFVTIVCVSTLVLAGCGASPSTPPTAPATSTAAAPRSPLGTGLDGVVYWSTELQFNDVFKSSGSWMSGTAENWDDHRPLDLDASGWVRSLRPGQRATTLMMWGKQMWIGGVHRAPTGRYTVEYEGEGTIEYDGANVIKSAPGCDVIELAPQAPGGLALMITSTNPRNYIRNIRVLLPNSPAGETFNPRFIESLRRYRLIRFLGWLVGSSAEELDQAPARWSTRRKMDAARWDSGNGGPPFEIMVELANRLDVDVWFSIHHLADDEYARSLATLLRDGLEPERKVYVEHSNEVWHPGVSTNAYATKRGIELGLAESEEEWARDYEAWTRYHARRTREVGAIFRKVLGEDRVVVVLATQADVPDISEAMLSWNGTAADVDALATAPYFGYDVTVRDSAPLLEQWTLDDLFHELQTKTVPTMNRFVAEQAAIARKHGVRLVTYEAGQHLVNLDGNESPHVTELFDAANRDPRIGPLYTSLLTEWNRHSGGDIVVFLMNCGQAGTSGRWGHIEYLGQPRSEAPKHDAIQRWMEGR